MPKREFRQSLPTSVAGLISDGAWISSSLGGSSHSTATHILAMDLPHLASPDFQFWRGNLHGQYTIKSGYWWLQSRGIQNVNHFWKEFWRLPCLPKWKMFMWKLLNNALPTSHAIVRRTITTLANCLFCADHLENPEHLFRDCHVTRHVWQASLLGIRVNVHEYFPLSTLARNFLFMFF